MAEISRYSFIIVIFFIILAAVAAGVFITRKDLTQEKLTPTQERMLPRDTILPQGISKTSVADRDIEVVAEGLSIPWEIVFLPDGDLLITERPGTLKRIGKEGRVYVIDGVEHTEEGGLLGLALHPQFLENRWIYLYFTTKSETGLIMNRVERYRFAEGRLSEKKTIINSIPGASYHDGGRIAFERNFGPEYYLYITTGDAGNPDLAQDINSLAGKILRLNDDGSVPADNPFGNAVYSYGHRNPQGLVWDSKGRLWATEHGPSLAQSGFDELNLIEKGANYGWPIIKGDEKRAGLKTPVIHSGQDDTWAPAGAVSRGTSIFFTGLRGQSLYEAEVNEGGLVVRMIAHLRKDFGRLRALVEGPDGYLYLTTSNTDGRGVPREGDDKIIRINPDIFTTVHNAE